jgi:WD40 repeat protein
MLSADNLDGILELARWGKGVIADAVYSPDGTLLAVASTLGVSIYQADTLEEKSYFETTASITSLAFSPDGQSLATGLTDNTVGIWKTADGTLIKSFQNEADETARLYDENVQVNTVDFSPDGSILASGSSDGTVNLWQISDGTIILSPKPQGLGISSVIFSPDGATIFSAAFDGTMYRRQVTDGKLLYTYPGKSVVDATLSADGKVLATYDRRYYDVEGSLIIWDVESGKKLQTIAGAEKYESNDISSLAFSPDGQLLSAAWRDHTIKTWDVGSGVLQNTFEDLQPEDGWYYLNDFTAAFSPDGKSLLLAGSDSVGVWDVNNGTLLHNVPIKSNAIYALVVSPDGQILASVEGPDVYLRQIVDGNSISTQEKIQSNDSLAFLPDGSTLAVSMFDKTVRFWPLSETGLRKTFEMGQQEYIDAVAVSPDGKILALGGYFPAGKVELRQISDGSLISEIGFSSGRVTDMAFSNNGDMLAIAGNDQIRLYSASDGKQLKSFSKTGTELALSPDGALVAASYEQTSLRVWNASSGEAIYTIKELPDTMWNLVYSPDGTLLVVGYDEGTIEIRLAADGSLLKSWKGHSRGISDLMFTSDGNLLISASHDGTTLCDYNSETTPRNNLECKAEEKMRCLRIQMVA